MNGYGNALRLARSKFRGNGCQRGNGYGPGNGLGPHNGDGSGNCVNIEKIEENVNSKLHETYVLDDQQLDMNRLMISLSEEIEAISFYEQRVAASSDQNIKNLMQHNRDEEIEHAVMIIDEISNRDKVWKEHILNILMREK